MFKKTSLNGTLQNEARKIALYINNNVQGVACTVEKKEAVNENSINDHLSNNSVLVCDTENGKHSIVIAGIKNSLLQIFDPDWPAMCELYADSDKKEKWKISLRNKHINAQVPINIFVDKRNNGCPFRMGALKNRFMIVLSKQ